MVFILWPIQSIFSEYSTSIVKLVNSQLTDFIISIHFGVKVAKMEFY